MDNENEADLESVGIRVDHLVQSSHESVGHHHQT
jgi:hypothetical protein